MFYGNILLFFLQKLFSPHFASTLPPTSCIPLSIGIYPAVEATKKRWKQNLLPPTQNAIVLP